MVGPRDVSGVGGAEERMMEGEQTDKQVEAGQASDYSSHRTSVSARNTKHCDQHHQDLHHCIVTVQMPTN